jgi:Lrp/AsnC family transcriptional regulator, leucine-responsive regulatory protein
VDHAFLRRLDAAARWTFAQREAMLRSMADSRRIAASNTLGADLDSFDVAILNLVQDNNQLSSHQIGASVGLSPSAVQRRLKHLRKTGVIMADVALVAPAVAGNRVTIIVEVSLEREQLQQRREFERAVCALPEVVQCYYVTGRADFVLILNMTSMDAYGEFTNAVFFANPNVKQFYTAVVMSTTKFTTRVALGADR